MAAARMVRAVQAPQRDAGPAAPLALALAGCVYCHGTGYLPRYYTSCEGNVCACVWREVFRACWERYRECCAREWTASRVNWQRSAAGGLVRGFKAVEYIADCELTARRTLRGIDCRVFEMRYVLGMDHRWAMQRLRLDKGTFFHSVYRIERTLGRAFAGLKPYSLFPASYFAGTYLENPLMCIRQASKGMLNMERAA